MKKKAAKKLKKFSGNGHPTKEELKREKSIVRLRRMHFTFQQIADNLDISQPNACRIYHRAMNR